jgi:purine-binding chemotaxis protein CheW
MTDLFVLGWIGGQRIAFHATGVEAVVDIAMVVSVPLAADHVIGLAAIRSQVITVIDGSVATGGRHGPPTGRAVVAEIEGHRYAIRVDRIDDVIAAELHAASDAMPLAHQWRELAVGVIETGGTFAVVVDPARLVAVQPTAIAA